MIGHFGANNQQACPVGGWLFAPVGDDLFNQPGFAMSIVDDRQNVLALQQLQPFIAQLAIACVFVRAQIQVMSAKTLFDQREGRNQPGGRFAAGGFTAQPAKPI